MKATKEQVKATVATVQAVAEAIRKLGQVPNGVLYAQAMPHMSFETYERIIALLKDTGLVEEEFHMLHWRGPQLETKEETTV